MHLVNLFDIESPYGTRSFKLMEGDIADVNIEVDIVITGAFKGEYQPTPGSLLGALFKKRGILIDDNNKEGAEDYRDVFGTLYYPIKDDPHIHAILVLEMLGHVNIMKDAIQNLHITLSVLEAKGYTFKNVIMPLIGTGYQQIEPEIIMGDLIQFAKTYLQKSTCLQQIWLVSNSSKKTANLNKAMNQLLGRPVTTMPISELTSSVKKEIINCLNKLHNNKPGIEVSNLKNCLEKKNLSVLELAIQIRQWLEWGVAQNISQDDLQPELYKNISNLKSHQFAPWIISYMHLLRTFANEYAHSHNGPVRKPKNIVEEDLTLALFALQRVVNCWTDQIIE